MSKFAPWTDEQAEKWAREIFERLVPHNCKTSDNEPLPVERSITMTACLEILEKAAAQIEKCPTMYGSHVGDPINRYWESTRASCDTHQAKLVGVREVEK